MPGDGTDDKFEEDFDVDGLLDSFKDMFDEVSRGNVVCFVLVFGLDLKDETAENFVDDDEADLFEDVGDTLGDDLGEIFVKVFGGWYVFLDGVVFDFIGVVKVEDDLVVIKSFFFSVS